MKVRTFKTVTSKFVKVTSADTYVYELTMDQHLDDVDRAEAMAIGCNIYERWFMSKGLKRWFFGLLVKRYR